MKKHSKKYWSVAQLPHHPHWQYQTHCGICWEFAFPSAEFQLFRALLHYRQLFDLDIAWRSCEVCTATHGQHIFSMLLTLDYVHQCQPMLNRCFPLHQKLGSQTIPNIAERGTLPEDLERDQLLKTQSQGKAQDWCPRCASKLLLLCTRAAHSAGWPPAEDIAS